MHATNILLPILGFRCVARKSKSNNIALYLSVNKMPAIYRNPLDIIIIRGKWHDSIFSTFLFSFSPFLSLFPFTFISKNKYIRTPAAELFPLSALSE